MTISIVIPVFNEEQALPLLFARLVPTLAGLRQPYEIVFVDDGSTDGSLSLLKTFGQKAPAPVVIVELSRNVGQYVALLAALRAAQGGIVVVLDADLQNPPEEIPSLVARIDAGHDVVTGYRAQRQDNWLRRTLSRAMNHLRARLTPFRLRDHGCMLAAYRRDVIDQVIAEKDARVFLPGLAAFYARNPAEIPVRHEQRAAGISKYTPAVLLKSVYEVTVSFSMAPFQFLPVLGAGIFILGLIATIAAAVWGGSGPGFAAILTALNIALMGLVLAALGLLGEYVFRLHQTMTGRPGYVVRNVHRLGRRARKAKRGRAR
jgi:undecaprenyl-phosphate 4-deoxy-4-formamido-L-arabinose transferase